MRSRRVYDSLPGASRSKLIALPSDLSDPKLGLSEETYNILTSEITGVIHCAWSVNFNLHLRSFVKDNIAGLKHLINLCLRSQRPDPASFNFCSSISAAINSDDTKIPESLPGRLSYAQDMGYAQSKLVGEYICSNASRQTSLTTRVLRIGQVVGDTQHGIWNSTEAIPLMLQCADTIGALPRLDEYHLWLPVDTVADVVIDVSLSSSPTFTSNPCEEVFNIVSPHPLHWTNDLLPYLRDSGLSFEELAPSAWIQRLRSSNPDPSLNPPIKLLEFFAAKYDSDQPRQRLKWCSENTKKVSLAFECVQAIDNDLVGRIVRFLRAVWVN